MQPQTQTTSRLKTNLEHLKNHIKYPADRNTVLVACNNMSDVSGEDKTWFTTNLPEGTFNGPLEVLGGLLKKV